MKRAQRRKYHYIYKTTCKITKRYYYGMHSTDNLDDNYFGSGSELSKSIKKYGLSNHDKEIIEFYENREELKERESYIVNENIFKDPLCMNLAKGGGGSNFAGELISVKDENGKTFCVHKDDSRYLKGKLVGITKGTVTVKDKNGKNLRIKIDDPRYLSDELIHNKKNIVGVKDKNDKRFCVSMNDPRYLSGELVSYNKDKIIVKDDAGENFYVNINDPRYLSGELKCIWLGKKHKEESKRKIGLSNSTKQKGENNSQYGTCWITNGKVNKKIRKEDNIPSGWKLGRKIKV
jgi:hypothetical protein